MTVLDLFVSHWKNWPLAKALFRQLGPQLSGRCRCRVVTIERVMTYKLLGVYVSNDLKWNHHVEAIVQKGNRRLYSLRVLKQCGAPPTSLAKVYTTIVRPVLEYAAPVWQNIPDFLSYKIESIQRRAVRIIFP